MQSFVVFHFYHTTLVSCWAALVYIYYYRDNAITFNKTLLDFQWVFVGKTLFISEFSSKCCLAIQIYSKSVLKPSSNWAKSWCFTRSICNLNTHIIKKIDNQDKLKWMRTITFSNDLSSKMKTHSFERICLFISEEFHS